MKPILALVAFIAISTGIVQGEQKPVVVSFRNVGTLLMIDVRVNGEPKEMIFDSGAQRTALNYKTQSDRVMTAIIDIDRNRWFNFEIILSNLSPMFAVLGEGDGVIGQDFMRQFSAISIDYKSHKITLTY